MADGFNVYAHFQIPEINSIDDINELRERVQAEDEERRQNLQHTGNLLFPTIVLATRRYVANPQADMKARINEVKSLLTDENLKIELMLSRIIYMGKLIRICGSEWHTDENDLLAGDQVVDAVLALNEPEIGINLEQEGVEEAMQEMRRLGHQFQSDLSAEPEGRFPQK